MFTSQVRLEAMRIIKYEQFLQKLVLLLQVNLLWLSMIYIFVLHAKLSNYEQFTEPIDHCLLPTSREQL